MAYVYRHIRLDKNVPFYIGIGSDEDGKYERAFSFNGYHRNRFWKKIATISNIEVEIVIDNISWSEACKKEIEFISIYKRVRDGGTLANITLGGEGAYGLVHSEASNEKNRKAHVGKTAWNKGKKSDPQSVEKMRKAKIGKPTWNKGKSMSDQYKAISRKSKMKFRKSVIQKDIYGNYISEFESVRDAEEKTGFDAMSIRAACRNKLNIKYQQGNIYRKFIWEYKKEAPKEAPN